VDTDVGQLLCLPGETLYKKASLLQILPSFLTKNIASSNTNTQLKQNFPPKTINMSDNMRKGLGEQAGEKLTPQSQKSTGQVISENVSSTGDKIAGAVQPNSEKSTTQKLGDSTRSNADSAQNESGSYLDSAKDTLSGAGNSITDTFNSATGQAKDASKS